MTCIYLGDAGGREGENAAGMFLISELATKTNSKNNPTNRGPPPTALIHGTEAGSRETPRWPFSLRLRSLPAAPTPATPHPDGAWPLQSEHITSPLTQTPRRLVCLFVCFLRYYSKPAGSRKDESQVSEENRKKACPPPQEGVWPAGRRGRRGSHKLFLSSGVLPPKEGVCVSVCVCMGVCTYTCVSVHACAHTCLAGARAHVHAHVHEHAHTCASHMHACASCVRTLCIYAHVCTHGCVHACMRVFVCTRVHACVCVHV